MHSEADRQMSDHFTPSEALIVSKQFSSDWVTPARQKDSRGKTFEYILDNLDYKLISQTMHHPKNIHSYEV